MMASVLVGYCIPWSDQKFSLAFLFSLKYFYFRRCLNPFFLHGETETRNCWICLKGFLNVLRCGEYSHGGFRPTMVVIFPMINWRKRQAKAPRLTVRRSVDSMQSTWNAKIEDGTHTWTNMNAIWPRFTRIRNRVIVGIFLQKKPTVFVQHECLVISSFSFFF